MSKFIPEIHESTLLYMSLNINDDISTISGRINDTLPYSQTFGKIHRAVMFRMISTMRFTSSSDTHGPDGKQSPFEKMFSLMPFTYLGAS